MNHHTRATDCPLCDEKRQTMHPELLKWWDAIKKEFPEAHVAWAFRDQALQNLFFEQGRTNAKWPNSMHNTMKDEKPCSRAMDLFMLRPDNVAVFPYTFYKQIAEWLSGKGGCIEWAGHWTHFKESDHFQLMQGVP